MSARAVCRLADLKEKEARGCSLELDDGSELQLIVVREGSEVFVYRNRCPHTGVNLEWQAHQFYDLSGAFLQCATHGALFRPEDGYCVRGPCAGESLEAVPVWILEGQVVVIT